ncbi:ribose-phosphate pyrophosphokinase [Metamycoplasma hyosynoviae]|uniref:Ribose-phosphate pyrophosphokinase n=1 Tax=Metamycoplasma hyosynoviae TaxID=29559 RepID=A0A063YG87_9BACT|nr:ribose-phosphate pyrophosphokinase [Metamycoplasma hyosynoviae]ASI53832.1 ribose-phosphate pyrophosphokinase [Metamycoplasma hyosynoviae]KDE43287.1 ribose-phosphate pyrophosphokinase [Metamycoplasma hyosynoviae]MDC8900235.1 ribose-phosphate pyrophosphokinase [Metamycoplasma hyosynoviae]MDC8900937.1 ribose-phosphate pyrophosphokinase [Metamycoplasma hyosynoviae]MDC8911445.1 ribose-phosphate pyrophosphokinase [Metamycoplasma hyosynoviae]
MENKKLNDVVIFGMDNSIQLAKRIGKYIKTNVEEVEKITFADGENLLFSDITVRNKSVFVICNTAKPVNENLMQLLIFIDSLKRASAKHINVVITYYGYARQDRKAAGRQPITAKLVADLLEKAGCTKIIAIDLHNPSIQGFFNIPVDDLRGQFIFANELRSRKNDFVIVSPDHGGAVRARQLSELLNNGEQIAIIDKRRTGPNVSEIMGVLGNVKDKNVVIFDDIIDTGGTIINATRALKEKGAKKIIVAATHGLFSKGFEMFENEPVIDEVIITDSTNKEDLKHFKKLKILSLAEFLSMVIEANINKTSITEVYDAYGNTNK